MLVKVGRKVSRCHCPTTGRLGNLQLPSLRCLLSKSLRRDRKTAYTVEAVSPGISKEKGSWIGINQTAVNGYVHHFLLTGQLSRMVSGEVRREVKLGRSRIDFKVGKTYLEVKTPLITLDPRGGPTVQHSRFNSFDRLIKHFSELSSSLNRGGRAIVALCYLYDAPAFERPSRDRFNSRIIDAVESASAKGVESWQINMAIDEWGVSLLRYFQLDR
jgi:sugar fermentation stimulation protein A